MNLKKIIIASFTFIALSGCATAINGTEDQINIKSEHEQDMTCKIAMGDDFKEHVIQKEKNNIIIVERQSDEILLECKNDDSELTYNIEPSFDGEFIALNILVDFCLISCPIDLISGAFYDYPEQIILKK